MTFFEWLGMLAATAILTYLGFMAGLLIGVTTNVFRRYKGEGLEGAIIGLWIGAALGLSTLVACLVLIWGLNPLPFL